MNTLKRLEPITQPEHEFKSCDEFDVFYSKNKQLLDNETTHKLNKRYKIPGYKITRRTVQSSEGSKTVLCLKKVPISSNTSSCAGINTQLDARMTSFEEKLDSIISVLNAIVDKLNGTNTSPSFDRTDQFASSEFPELLARRF